MMEIGHHEGQGATHMMIRLGYYTYDDQVRVLHMIIRFGCYTYFFNCKAKLGVPVRVQSVA